jgi:hypothetical protein
LLGCIGLGYVGYVRVEGAWSDKLVADGKLGWAGMAEKTDGTSVVGVGVSR